MAGAPARGQGAPRARGGPLAGGTLTGQWSRGGWRGRGRGRRRDERGRPAGGRGRQAGEGSAGLEELPGGRERAGAVGSRGGSQGRARLCAVTAPRPAHPARLPYLSLHSGAPGRSAQSPDGERRPQGEARGRDPGRPEAWVRGQVGARRLLSASRFPHLYQVELSGKRWEDFYSCVV